MDYKLGRKPRTYKPSLHWSAIRGLRQGSTAVPTSFDWAAKLPEDLGMMANDQVGDCVEAQAYHARQVWSGAARPPVDTQPDTAVLLAYSECTGYLPSDPSTDQGTNMQDFYKYWANSGLPLAGSMGRDKLLAPAVEIDVRNLEDIERAVWECGCIAVGFHVPAYLMVGEPPETWGLSDDGDQSIVGGHCVGVTGFDITNFCVISWGSHKYRMTNGFWNKYVDEAYALVDAEWIEKSGQTPLGLGVEDWKRLVADL